MSDEKGGVGEGGGIEAERQPPPPRFCRRLIIPEEMGGSRLEVSYEDCGGESPPLWLITWCRRGHGAETPWQGSELQEMGSGHTLQVLFLGGRVQRGSRKARVGDRIFQEFGGSGARNQSGSFVDNDIEGSGWRFYFSWGAGVAQGWKVGGGRQA